MTDAEQKDLVASIAESQKELVEQQKRTDQQLAKTDAQLDRSSRKRDRLGELVGNIGNNKGDIAEEFFYRSFLKNPPLAAMQFDTVNRNLNGHRGGIQEEYDLVLINGDSLMVLEVKAKAHEKDLGHYRQFAGLATLASHTALTANAEEPILLLVTHKVVAREGRVIGCAPSP